MKFFLILVFMLSGINYLFAEKQQVVAGEQPSVQKSQQSPVDLVQTNEQPGNNSIFILEAAQSFGVGSLGLDLARANVLYAYKINENFSIGGGTGFRVYFDNGGFFMPILADMRYRFKENAVSEGTSAYINLQFGYTIDFSDDDWSHAGPVLNAGSGFAFMLGNGNKINAGLSLDMMKLEFVRTVITSKNVYRIYEDKYSPGVSINIGYEF